MNKSAFAAVEGSRYVYGETAVARLEQSMRRNNNSSGYDTAVIPVQIHLQSQHFAHSSRGGTTTACDTCLWLRYIPAALIPVVNHLLNHLLTHSSRYGTASDTSLDSAVIPIQNHLLAHNSRNSTAVATVQH